MPKPPKHKRKDASGDGTKSSPPTPASDLDPFENFEIELLWCIQQLESSISAKKMNPRTVEDSMKTLSTLKSNKAPLIKKRQVMRTLFGDYRAKMAEEEKKFYKVNSKLKFVTSSIDSNSKFLKKSSTLTSQPGQLAASCALSKNEPAGEKMLCAKVVTSEATENKAILNTENNSFSFKPSDNQFRFKFSSSEES